MRWRSMVGAVGIAGQRQRKLGQEQVGEEFGRAIYLELLAAGCGLAVDAGFGSTGSCGFGPPELG